MQHRTPAARTLAVLSALTAVTLGSSALAQSPADAWPAKPVAIVVPTNPGGSTDLEGRLYAQKLSEGTGKTFLVDFKPGAGNAIGSAYVAKAAPDGYTLLLMSPSSLLSPLVYPEMAPDPVRDFAHVSLMSKRPSLILAHPGLPANNLREFLAYAKANQDKVNIGTAGAGSVGHLAVEWLYGTAGAKVTFVHYKGGGPAAAALIANQIHSTIGSPGAVLAQVKAGKLKILAVTTTERIKLLPDVPTAAESGAPSFEYVQWLGFVAPAGTPAPIVNKLAGELLKVSKSPDVAQRFANDGILMIGNTPEQFRQYVITESARWSKLVKDTGIKLNAD